MSALSTGTERRRITHLVIYATVNSTCSHRTPTLSVSLVAARTTPRSRRLIRTKVYLCLGGCARGLRDCSGCLRQSRVQGERQPPTQPILFGWQREAGQQLLVTVAACYHFCPEQPRVTCTHTLPSGAKCTQSQGEWGGDLNSSHREALVADGVVRCALHIPGRAWLSDQPNHPSHLLCARHSAASTLTHVRVNRAPSLKAAAV